MRSYRTAWQWVTRALVLAGLCVATLVFPWSGLLVVAIVTALVTGLLARAWTWAGSDSPRRVTWVALTTTGAVLAAASLLEVLGPSGLLVLALVAATSPAAVTHVVQWCSAEPGRPAAASQAPPSTRSQQERAAAASWSAERTLTRAHWMRASTAAMDPTSLCVAWRQSYQTLQRPLSAASRTLVIKRRQELLDELERRNPPGFAAWLDSGALATSDPRRFIFSQGGPETRPQ